jgi:hypothetical protein
MCSVEEGKKESENELTSFGLANERSEVGVDGGVRHTDTATTAFELSLLMVDIRDTDNGSRRLKTHDPKEDEK